MYRFRTILVAATVSLVLAGCAADDAGGRQQVEEGVPAGAEDSPTPPRTEHGDISVPQPVEIAALPRASSVKGLVLAQPTSASDCHIMVFDHGELSLRGTYENSPGGAGECYSARQYSPDYTVHVAWDHDVLLQRIGEPAVAMTTGLNMILPVIGPDGNVYATASEPPAMAISGGLTKFSLAGEILESLPYAPQSVAWLAGKMIDVEDLAVTAADPSGTLAVELVSIAGGSFIVGALEQVRPGDKWRVTGDVAEVSGAGAFEPRGWIADDRFLTIDNAGTLYVNTIDMAGPSVEVEELAPLPAEYSYMSSGAKVCGDEAFVFAGAKADGAPVSVLLGVELSSGTVTAYAAIPSDEETPGQTLRARILDCVG